MRISHLLLALCATIATVMADHPEGGDQALTTLDVQMPADMPQLQTFGDAEAPADPNAVDFLEEGEVVEEGPEEGTSLTDETSQAAVDPSLLDVLDDQDMVVDDNMIGQFTNTDWEALDSELATADEPAKQAAGDVGSSGLPMLAPMPEEGAAAPAADGAPAAEGIQLTSLYHAAGDEEGHDEGNEQTGPAPGNSFRGTGGESSSSGSSNSTIYIVVGSVAGVAGIALVAGFVVYKRRQKQRKEQSVLGGLGTPGANGVSVTGFQYVR